MLNKIDTSVSYDFDDVLVKPVPSSVNSRNDVDLSVKLSDFLTLDFPVIASPMLGITDAKFAILFAKLGGIAIIHRFYDFEKEFLDELELAKQGKIGVAVKLNDKVYEKCLEFEPDILTIDVGNGYTQLLLDFCSLVKTKIVNKGLKTLLMSGSVSTLDGVRNLVNSGVDLVRVGTGSGNLCSTRNVTAVGVPQISALLECSEASNVIIVADGGIKNSGDGVKAFVAGADILMLGSLFGQTFESPNKGTIFGMASKKLQEMKYTQIKSIEGIEKTVDKKMSLEDFVSEFSWGAKSAGTYLNARNIKEIRKNGTFILTGQGSIKTL